MTRRLVFWNLLAALAMSASATMAALDDWPQWRGPHRDGRSAEKNLLRTWPKGGPPLAWKAAGAGAGYSSFAVAGGRVFTLGARGNREYVIAFDAASGKLLWDVAHGDRFANDRGDGPRSTPTVDGARVYVFGASGDLTSLDAASGKIAWTVNVIRDFGGQNIRWGFSESPLVAGDRIIVSPGGSGAGIVAVNKANGKLLWKGEADTAGYSSAVLHEVGGVRQAIVFTGQRALGVDTNDGRVLWSYNRVANRVANIATPIARGNRVFLSSDYGTGAALLELTPSSGGIAAREVYFTHDMRNHHASSVLVGDYLYGFSSAILTAMKFDTGEIAWRDRSVGKGSLAFADDRLYVFSERGVAALVEPTPGVYREHGRFSLETGSLPTWTHPVVSNGKLFLRDQDTVYAYDVRSQ
jgi:outer membrane protein assembly factor BamB